MSSTVTTDPAATSPLRHTLEHAGLPALMAFIMLLLYLGGFHHPAPHDLDLAIVSEDTHAAASLEEKLAASLGDGAHLRTVPTPDEAEQLLRTREIEAAFIPVSDSATLMTASGASATTAESVKGIFQRVAQAEAVPLAVVDVVPVAANDPIGQNNFFFLVALSVGSYAMSIAISAAGSGLSFRRRVAVAAGAAVVVATVFAIAAYALFGLFRGTFAPSWALSVVYSIAVLFVGVGLHPLLGRFSTLVYATMFVGLNFTSSGGVFGPEMQNAFFRTFHEFWIGAGFIEATRTIEYFPGMSLAHPLGILAAWLLVGAACLAIGSAVDRKNAEHPVYYSEKDVEEIEELEENVAPA